MDNLRITARDAKDGGSRPSLRRIPKQDRSRERIDEILKVAMELIGQRGIDAVTMKEIASLSGGPIASVYQYFPNKSAIVATLYERHVGYVMTMIRQSITQLHKAEDIYHAVDTMVDLYSRYVNDNPHIQDLVNAIHADKVLCSVEFNETRKMADIFADATEKFVPSQLHTQYRRTSTMMFHMTECAVRLSLNAPAGEGEQILSDFKAAARTQIRLFLDGTYNQRQ